MKKPSPLFWSKLALKELLNNQRFSLFFLFNLALGLAGFIALDSFKDSLDTHLGRNSQAILGADIALTSYVPIDDHTLRNFESMFPESTLSARKISLFTMVASKERSVLVQVTGLSENFPFYGKIILEKSGIVDSKMVRDNLGANGEAWIYPELLFMLNINEGGSVDIGESSFPISDSVTDDPSSSMSSFGLAPRIYVGINKINETGMLSKKSRVSYQYLYRLPEGTALNILVENLRGEIKNFDNSYSKIRVRTHKRAANNLGRVLGYLNDYLGLIALIAVFLAGIGAAYLFRNYLVHRFREMSILMSLGATRQQTYLMVLWQLVFLGTGAALISIIFSLGILPLLEIFLENFLPRGFETNANVSSLIFALVLGSVGSLVFCLPVLTRIHSVQPLMLLRETKGKYQSDISIFRQALSYLPLIILSWVLSVWQSQSFIVGSAFVGMLFCAVLLLGSLSWLTLLFAGKLSQTSGNTIKKMAFRNLQRNRTGAISCFIALSLGTLLINLIPQIYQGLQEEISRPADFRIPSLFLFDIQPEQVEPLQNLLAEKKINLNYISPMVRARLEKVNGKIYKAEINEGLSTRERQREQGFRMRTLNLSYRTELSDSELIVKGRKLAGSYDWKSDLPAEVSLEERFADRMGLKLGDLLSFNVHEVPIIAKVINLRKVKWNSFQPNFFILFQSGVLNDAPATYLASMGGLDKVDRMNYQNLIVKNFPNISVIDVTRTVERILKISDQMVIALRFMAYLSIMAGLVVVFSIARHEVQGRLWELNLLKVLGAKFNDIQKMIQIEFAVLGFSAGLFGVGISLIMSYGIAWWFFENLWKWTWQTSLVSVVGVTALSVVVAWIATRRTLSISPLNLLRSS